MEIQDIPAYLFTGFLESGKTSFIQESLEDEYFNSGENILLLLCEEGIEEYDREKFASPNVYIEVIDSPEQLSAQKLHALTEMCNAESVIIEYNGMWDIQTLVDNTPEEWLLYQNMFFADASTIMTFNSNMRNLVADKMKFCDSVVFNRFTDEMDKMEYHKLVRTFNRRTDIMYEYSPERVELDNIPDPLPYDMDADVIEIDDEDYAVWYRDVNEEIEKYIGKTVEVKGRILLGGGLPGNSFIIGRHVMTCCVEDIEFCGVVCKASRGNRRNINAYENGDWVTVKAVITEEEHKAYHGEPGPVLSAVEIVAAQEPEEDVAVFYR